MGVLVGAQVDTATPGQSRHKNAKAYKGERRQYEGPPDDTSYACAAHFFTGVAGLGSFSSGIM